MSPCARASRPSPSWTAKDERGFPELTAKLMVDCRPGSLKVERWRETMKTMTARDEDATCEALDLGRGGGHITMKVAGSETRSVNVVHATVPCALSVRSVLGDADHSRTLAEHVHGARTADVAVMP